MLLHGHELMSQSSSADVMGREASPFRSNDIVSDWTSSSVDVSPFMGLPPPGGSHLISVPAIRRRQWKMYEEEDGVAVTQRTALRGLLDPFVTVVDENLRPPGALLVSRLQRQQLTDPHILGNACALQQGLQ
ncbi:hypothetical protein GW17_00016881 [Ensete ventricosum]|nr:hypothetical protein GW17_00016881 [Ensete ventricosum]RZR90228.1 hypothetical protein BHM03_00018088 [Ensete ventricosum]